MEALIVSCGALLNFIGTSFYIRDTLAGKTKPNRVTWLMWSIAPMIGTAAAISSGVTWAVVPVAMTGICPFLVLLASLRNRNGYWQLGAFDYACGAFSALALVLWLATQSTWVAIVFAILADGAAGLPTLIKAWRFPETESPLAFVASALSVIPSFIVATPSFAAYAFPVYLIALNSSIAVGAMRRS